MSVENIQIGSCRVVYGGVDLGYTQGGVTLSIKVSADTDNAFGKQAQHDYIASTTEIKVQCSLVQLSTETLLSVFPWTKRTPDRISVKDIFGQGLRQYAKTLILEPQNASDDSVIIPVAVPLVDSTTSLTSKETRSIDVVFVALRKSATDNTLIEFVTA